MQKFGINQDRGDSFNTNSNFQSSLEQQRERVRIDKRHIFDQSHIPSLAEAQAIVSLVKQVYGDKYPNTSFVQHEHICEMINSGEYIIAALQNKDGEMLGIGAISKFDYLGSDVEAYGKVCEFCKLMVAP